MNYSDIIIDVAKKADNINDCSLKTKQSRKKRQR